MLSNLSRYLTYACAILYAVLGALLFFLPESLASGFAWKVTPFMTMTIGAWCLGNAWLAYVSARRWDWQLVSTSLLYLWLFGITECVVLLLFRSKLVLSEFTGWMYFFTLGVNLITAVVGIADWLRLKPTLRAEEPQLAGLIKILPIGAVLFTGSIGLFGLLVPLGFMGTNNKEIFPEVMTSFTLRAFASFYFSLAMAVIPLLKYPNLRLFMNHLYGASGFLLTVTAAAFAYIGLFDFAAHPVQLVYIGAYVVVAIMVGFALLKYGTGLTIK
ncbi:MAG: hypothetical protein H7Y59_07250 [Anaerolineales bacterium]|nr:hypothetical protein [Anaerolineales bacterium]